MGPVRMGRISNPVGETRDQREEVTKLAIGQVVREHLAARRLGQHRAAQSSGLSRSFVQDVVRAQRSCSLFLFLELSCGLKADPCELLRAALRRREALRERAADKLRLSGIKKALR
jgi:hypothetical protein